MKGMSGHNLAVVRSDEWLTPPEILRVLGEFDLDPAAPLFRPWPTAKHHYTLEDNGLVQPWFGRVWLNPPYGDDKHLWMRKMSLHRYGIMLIPAATDTEAFHQYVFKHADSMLFLEGRLNFYTVAGTRSRSNNGAASVLIGYSERDSSILAASGLRGHHQPLGIQLLVVSVSPSWKNVVDIALTRLRGTAELKRIYDLVSVIAPDKLRRNKHYHAKVRQVLQQHFKRVKKGHYERH